MVEPLTISPLAPETGMAITVTLNDPNVLKAAPFVLVTPINKKGELPFRVPLNKLSSQSSVAQFALYHAGTYKLEAGPWSTSLSVKAHEDLTFFVEFGFLATAVLFSLGALILWIRKRKAFK